MIITNYKEIADRICENLFGKGINLKGICNVKRRIYDALNVLIAAGIIVKLGKFVARNRNTLSSDRKIQKLQFQHQLDDKQSIIIQKRLKLKKSQRKLKLIE